MKEGSKREWESFGESESYISDNIESYFLSLIIPLTHPFNIKICQENSSDFVFTL